MNILFICYWGIREGLSSATVIPHVKILASFPHVEKILLCSIEREGNVSPVYLGDKIQHIPLVSKKQNSVLLTKANDFSAFSKILRGLCELNKINLIICRSSLAGAIGYLLYRKTQIPYVVESFEPHAEYMADNGIWKRYDPRFLIQRFFESRICRTAKALLPVSFHNRDKLIANGVKEEKIIVQPCCVDMTDFAYSEESRKKIRIQYGIPEDATVAIYLGKFGHMYYDVEAFQLYRDAFQFFGRHFYLIILSADPPASVEQYIRKFQLPSERIIIKKAAHDEVPGFLSAADFAFSTYRWSPSKVYLSPIKNGEYWANGLPVLLEPGIGHDWDIIKNEGGGVILNMREPQPAFAAMQGIINKGRNLVASIITPIAFKHRRMELIREAYGQLFSK